MCLLGACEEGDAEKVMELLQEVAEIHVHQHTCTFVATYSYCSSYPTLRSVFILSVILTLLKAELIKMVILYLSNPFSSCTV